MSKTHTDSPKNNGRTIWAAGGVLWRRDGEAVRIGLVHRPRYDDWTLPKGKQDPGETLIATAVRELAEETGHAVRLGRHLTKVSYDLANGRKHVRYWSAEAVGGEFEPNHEVDVLEWFDIESAQARLSYRLDRKVLHEFTRLPLDLTPLLLVRHAMAGRRSRYKGDDRTRPLDKTGRRQAQALVPILSAFGVSALSAADRVRCVQTLEPAAAALGVGIGSEPTLSEEAYRDEPGPGRDRIVELAGTDDGVVRAVCSQGKVIPPLLDWWSERDGVTVPAARNRKGSIWVLFTSGGRLQAADHIESPLPHEAD
ncbi:NUDIX hydrolase [Gordonia desulfuricans]|uniref:NUDIX hydrolase n=1 Tax=Gordonia desulfuricans TaxID=89051 RepID=A0A7K3LJB5_9ACTN|nr:MULTISPECIES: NUDIX hydrolase [Gordonia]KOY49847.1 NUDIX hydrolase [Gordonia sp. NB41Y]NDK88336.1 NUDIX hydrolase [Gordonia desulfuricans]WLP90152.1 NUDIX hydrolase [Gordonia sp. NB41Y]